MTNTPTPSRQPASKTPSAMKSAYRPNQSILQFFGKSDQDNETRSRPRDESPLFFKDVYQNDESPEPTKLSRRAQKDAKHARYNEDEAPVKRRRTFEEDDEFIVRTPSPERSTSRDEMKTDTDAVAKPKVRVKKIKQRGGFLDDSSDEEEEDDNSSAVIDKVAAELAPPDEGGHNRVSSDNMDIETGSRMTRVLLKQPNLSNPGLTDEHQHERTDNPSGLVPRLKHEQTSGVAVGEFGEDDFEDDEFFEGGEEYIERRWMEEQQEMEMAFDEDSKSESGVDSIRTPRSNEDDVQIGMEDGLSVCPICAGSMKGLSETQASSHVNACLDGNDEPLPQQSLREETIHLQQFSSPSDFADTQDDPAPTRFRRAAIARPAQSNPFSLADKTKGGSAFTRLMSGHAEDAAWAEAAANQAQSRGKPAYQRTCPFYKIMPGFYICVDAFRYGKVEGQNAYFLSHFHSDHYIGLTSSWCHGPIYASKVTCNLMVQQLKVDSKWVVPLDFEEKVEVPNTKGVFVTMIPANHCPGSSLYLFEKVTGKNRDGSPKATRVLHCGDFRACPAHVSHPLLRPDVIDKVSGQNKQQIIDTCYLDTTYLTPRYSFPSQHDVIDACAQMCVSLSKEIVDTNDGWEQTKADCAGSIMKKYFEKGESNVTKDEGETDQAPKKRGRLLVVVGTYSIGKERICLGIAKALNSKIYAPPAKMRICKCLEDAELEARLTDKPLEAQVHMQTLMEIRADTLHDYMMTYKGHFARVVGFRPTGWSYRPPTSRFIENPAVNTVLHSDGWKTRFSMSDLAPQRGSTRESNCFGVPYSEHSSFRELTMFCCALHIIRIIPTVNVGTARSRERMKAWIDKWDAEKRKNGLYQVEGGAGGWGSGDGQLRYGV